MNKLVAGLALSTCAFAGSAYYFHGELTAARERHAAQSPTSTTASPGATASGPAAELPAARISVGFVTEPMGDTPPAPTAGTVPSQSTNEAARKIQAAVWSADFLKRYEDPEARAGMRALELSRLTSSLAGLDRKLKLDEGQWAKFRELMVDLELERRVVNARCTVDPACVRPGPAELAAVDAREQAIRDFLDEQNYQAMEQFQSLEWERRAVAGLQGRLPANLALSAAQSDALATALHEERGAQERELASRGRAAGRLDVDGMLVVYAKDAATQEQVIESAQQYLQRLRDQASPILNARQLAVFDQMQSDAITLLRRLQRQKLARQSDTD